MQNKSFHVVDTLIYISQVNLFKEKPKLKNNLKQLDSLDSLDKKYTFKNEYHCFNQTDNSSNVNLCFSKPIKNILLAESVNNRQLKKFL